MPKAIFTPIQLPPEQPDRCSRCPLLGKRPQSGDDQWEKWMSLPGRKYPITMEAWRERRHPYELEQELKHYKDLFKQRK